ncbi:hypothetical protein INQ11_24360, partial [Escherichia coli]|uniref:hypothetical protein n=1 Tax=Escherichia coli TaxID=562 RepID=UPI001931F848
SRTVQQLDSKDDRIEELEGKVDGLEQTVEDLKEQVEAHNDSDDGADLQDRLEVLSVAHRLDVEPAQQPLDCDVSTPDLKRKVAEVPVEVSLS